MDLSPVELKLLALKLKLKLALSFSPSVYPMRCQRGLRRLRPSRPPDRLRGLDADTTPRSKSSSRDSIFEAGKAAAEEAAFGPTEEGGRDDVVVEGRVARDDERRLANERIGCQWTERQVELHRRVLRLSRLHFRLNNRANVLKLEFELIKS